MFKSVREAIRYNSNLKEGIPELKLFMVNASEAQIDDEFEGVEESFMKTKSMIYPTKIENDFESVNDIQKAMESQMEVEKRASKEENDTSKEEHEENECSIFDEFTQFERSSINTDNIRSKLDLGYSTMNYRISLIPKIK